MQPRRLRRPAHRSYEEDAGPNVALIAPSGLEEPMAFRVGKPLAYAWERDTDAWPSRASVRQPHDSAS